MESEPKLVTCITCGFASKRTQRVTAAHPSLAYFEISLVERQDKVQFSAIDRHGPYDKNEVITQLACFVQASDLDAEASEHPLGLESAYQVRAKGVLEKARLCQRWYPYTSGLSPKDHVEMYNSERFFEISQKIQGDALEASKRNLAAAVKTYKATVVFGIVVVLLSIMQIAEVWYFSMRSNPPIIIQMPSQQPEPAREPPSTSQ